MRETTSLVWMNLQGQETPLFEELRIESLEQLRDAAAKGDVAGLKGFGRKTVRPGSNTSSPTPASPLERTAGTRYARTS